MLRVALLYGFAVGLTAFLYTEVEAHPQRVANARIVYRRPETRVCNTGLAVGLAVYCIETT